MAIKILSFNVDYPSDERNQRCRNVTGRNFVAVDLRFEITSEGCQFTSPESVGEMLELHKVRVIKDVEAYQKSFESFDIEIGERSSSGGFPVKLVDIKTREPVTHLPSKYDEAWTFGSDDLRQDEENPNVFSFKQYVDDTPLIRECIKELMSLQKNTTDSADYNSMRIWQNLQVLAIFWS